MEKKKTTVRYEMLINEDLSMLMTARGLKGMHRDIGKVLTQIDKAKAKHNASRSAKSGKFVSKKFAKSHPSTTVNETN